MAQTQFTSFGAFALHLASVSAGQVVAVQSGLEAVAQRIEKTAKAEIGHYQAAVGPFSAWQELAESTKAERLAQGYTENDPLLRSGELRDSYEHQVQGGEALIGTKDDKGLWQELGTPTIPPRPVLGPAVEYNHTAIKRILGGAVVSGVMGQTSIPSAYQYDHTV